MKARARGFTRDEWFKQGLADAKWDAVGLWKIVQLGRLEFELAGEELDGSWKYHGERSDADDPWFGFPDR